MSFSLFFVNKCTIGWAQKGNSNGIFITIMMILNNKWLKSFCWRFCFCAKRGERRIFDMSSFEKWLKPYTKLNIDCLSFFSCYLAPSLCLFLSLFLFFHHRSQTSSFVNEKKERERKRKRESKIKRERRRKTEGEKKYKEIGEM